MNKNKFEINGMNTKIFLNLNGDFTIISTKRLSEVISIKWSISKNKWGNYAHGRVSGKWVYLHRFIMGAKKGEIIDHIDRNRMNNTDENLGKSSTRENSYNRKIGRNSSIGVMGVGLDKRDGKYVARIKENYKYKILGYSFSLEEAIRIRLLYEIKYFGRNDSPQRQLFEKYGV
jgi:hypothetical protein